MENGVNRQGFSLVELMVVIAIMGILALLTMPRYFKWKPGYLARGVVSQVARDLNKVKMRTIETRRQARVTFNTNGYLVEDGNRVKNSTEWGNINSNGLFTKDIPLTSKDFSDYPGVYLSSTPALEFSPRGTGTTGVVTAVHDSYGSIDIAINLTGGVDIKW